jgi:hypothetical protein
VSYLISLFVLSKKTKLWQGVRTKNYVIRNPVVLGYVALFKVNKFDGAERNNSEML